MSSMVENSRNASTRHSVILRGTALVTSRMEINVGAVYLGGERCDPLVVVSPTELRCSVRAHLVASNELRVVPRSIGALNAGLESDGS